MITKIVGICFGVQIGMFITTSTTQLFVAVVITGLFYGINLYLDRS